MSESGRDRAYEFLKNTVLTDPAAQGAFLSEQDIAARIGISRTPVREALLRLAAEELVQLVPKRGAYIAPLTGRDLRDLVELRGLLERFAAEKTIADGSVPLDALRETLRGQRDLDGPGQAERFIELDTAFHRLLIEAAGNAMVARTYETLRARQVRAGLVALFHRPNRQQAVIAEHRAILDALAAGDVTAAHTAIDHHLETTLRIQLTSS
jgi:DNA-binding GntR family transcriptional regulator